MGNLFNVKTIRIVCIVLFIAYLLIVLYITVGRLGFRYEDRKINLTLFTDLFHVYKYTNIITFMRLLLGNIGWFVPFGFLLPILVKRNSFLFTIIAGASFSLTIEILQYFLKKGVAELDDLILNILGVVIGYFIYRFALHLL